jgi:ubiquinone/menaquinone biosynthesis C-methylase UbiE
MRKDLINEMFKLESEYWWHKAKRRLILHLCQHYKVFQKSNNILDVGCGTGMMMTELSSKGSVFGVDGSLQALSFCKKREQAKVLCCDLTYPLPFKSEYFDMVTILDVLEHLDNDSLILSEIRRILKSSGYFFLTVPAYPMLWTYWDVILGHKRRYRRKQLKKLLEDHGFVVKNSSYFYSFLLPVAIIFRLVKSLFGDSLAKSSDFIKLPKAINNLLLFLSKIEMNLIEHIRIPAGLSVICVCQKD